MTLTTPLHFTRAGNPNGPTVVLSHALGCDETMYSPLVAELLAQFDVITYDHRGHGQSASPLGPYGIEQMADDAAALISSECMGGPVHFVGTSLGGMVAQSLAVRHPSLLQSITVANSAMHYDDAARAMWLARIAAVRENGVGVVAEGAMQRWFSPGFRASHAVEVARCRAVLERCDKEGYLASCHAVMNIDFRSSNVGVACPVLVVAGALDEATPPALSQAMAQVLPHAKVLTLNAAHLSPIEQPTAFADLLRSFISASA